VIQICITIKILSTAIKVGGDEQSSDWAFILERRRCDITRPQGLKRTNISLRTDLGFMGVPDYEDAAPAALREGGVDQPGIFIWGAIFD
jgi:hypothetical protein